VTKQKEKPLNCQHLWNTIFKINNTIHLVPIFLVKVLIDQAISFRLKIEMVIEMVDR